MCIRDSSIRDWLYLDEGECHICYTDMLAAARRAAPGASLLVRGWRQSARYFAGGVGDMTHQERLVEAFSLPWHLEAAAEARVSARRRWGTRDERRPTLYS